jgi:hypothetical protein
MLMRKGSSSEHLGFLTMVILRRGELGICGLPQLEAPTEEVQER